MAKGPFDRTFRGLLSLPFDTVPPPGKAEDTLYQPLDSLFRESKNTFPDIAEIMRSVAVDLAFKEFRKNQVDLDPETVKTARASRDFLLQTIASRAGDDPHFPTLANGNREPLYFGYGSFARGVKRQPLDDIDLLIVLKAGGCIGHNDSILLDPRAPLAPFADATGRINSTAILNRIRDSLAKVAHYKKAEIHRIKSAVTVQLSSYDWNFDIVPGIAVAENGDGTGPWVHFLIPDGRGGWLLTDPRIDAGRMESVNARCNGYAKPTIRLLKYWNGRRGNTSLGSYHLESLALDIFSRSPISSITQGLEVFFRAAFERINQPFPDPKGLGPNLDADLTPDDRCGIWLDLLLAKNASAEAIREEKSGSGSAAIKAWQKIFGPELK